VSSEQSTTLQMNFYKILKSTYFILVNFLLPYSLMRSVKRSGKLATVTASPFGGNAKNFVMKKP